MAVILFTSIVCNGHMEIEENNAKYDRRIDCRFLKMKSRLK